MEIITGVERRRRWRLEDKLRIVAEAEALGSNCTLVARRHDVSRGLLWTWRRQFRRGQLRGFEPGTFLPVQVLAELPAPVTAAVDDESGTGRVGGAGSPVADWGATPRVEIALPDGVCVRVIGEISEAALRRVLVVLRG